MWRVGCVLVSWSLTMVKIARPSNTSMNRSQWVNSSPPFCNHFLILCFSLFPMSMMPQGLTPDPKTSCGPYTPTNGTSSRLVYCSLRDILLKHSLSCFLSHRIRSKPSVDEHNHDTISKHRFMQPCPPGLHIYTKIHACCMCQFLTRK